MRSEAPWRLILSTGDDAALADTTSVAAALGRLGLNPSGARVELHRLHGGVSSDVWRVERSDAPPCVAKRALEKLRVADDWHAPRTRNEAELAWLERAAEVRPSCVPAVYGRDEQAGIIVMQYLSPSSFPVWKQRLMAGDIDPEVARAVGDAIGELHHATAGDPASAERFAYDEILECTRIEPYLRATPVRHPELANAFAGLREMLADHKYVVIHGDLSPKNVLVGADGPVLIDGECACFGDPAFDLAFCGSHVLLKAVALATKFHDGLSACFDALVAAYMTHVDWEPPARLGGRSAVLLPGLMLARVDGKCPVEYIPPDEKRLIRRWATEELHRRSPSLPDLRRRWFDAVRRHLASRADELGGIPR